MGDRLFEFFKMNDVIVLIGWGLVLRVNLCFYQVVLNQKRDWFGGLYYKNSYLEIHIEYIDPILMFFIMSKNSQSSS